MVFELPHGPRAFALHLPRALIVQRLDLDPYAVVVALQPRVACAGGRA